MTRMKGLEIAKFDDFSTGYHLESSLFADTDPQSRFYGCKAAATVKNIEMTQNKLKKFSGFTQAITNALPLGDSGIFSDDFSEDFE